MTTLLTGGGSKTGTIIAELLKASGRSVLFASRSGRVPAGFGSVKLDWNDTSTFEAPFKVPGVKIQTTYILGPQADLDSDKLVNPFIDVALANGVQKFVVLTASSDMIGHVLTKQYLKEKGANYVLIRPTWFMENFTLAHAPAVKATGRFETSVPTGRIPHVSVSDIAQAAYNAIIDEKNEFKEILVIGPDNLTYDEAARIISEEIGKPVAHKAISSHEQIRRWTSMGAPEGYVRMLEGVQIELEAGSEAGLLERARTDKSIYVGKVTFKEWVKKNRDAFL